MNERSALKHKYMTLFRNIGVIAEGVELRFDDYHCGMEMGEYERYCLERLREASVNAPKVYGLHKLGGGEYMLVMEFIDGRPLSKVEINGDLIGRLFNVLRTMRENGIFHGDVKLDNFMLSEGRVYVFDCLKVDRSGTQEAAAFDLACMLAALSDKVPVDAVMSYARRYFTGRELERAAEMIDMALFKADLDISEERKKELKESLTA
jgi:tRNA A-37 threonylcarbamoyl transferase component Bud32